jgi:glycosyltransferase involved in cell wall biosynthesis
MNAPLVTVTFVAWQRRNALERGIRSVLEQDYPAIEVIVLDNSPKDDIHRWLLEAYPQVRSIKTAHPIPLPAARNILVATARGEFVVFHDDDSYFASPRDVSTAVNYAREHPGVACLAFRVGDGGKDWNPQFDGPDPAPHYTFIACATMFRRTDFAVAGWYYEGFWLYGEERVISLGFYGIGKEIHFLPTVSSIHLPEGTGRAADPGARYHQSDIVMVAGTALLKFPFPSVIFWYPALQLFYFLQVAFLRRRPIVAIKGLFVAFSMIPSFLRHRSPISRDAYRRWRAVRAKVNADYLRRTGRWKWYHSWFPAVG